MLSTPVHLGLALLSGALAIAAAPWALQSPWLLFVCKPLTTLLLIAWAWPRGAGDPARPWLRAGLLASLAGDVALLWPVQGFLPGLLSFLLAHLTYARAFTRRPGARLWWPALAGYLALAAVVLGLLWSGVPAPLRAPVLAYVGVLALMAALAASRWQRWPGEPAARRAALGAGLFMLSDALLATDRFAGPLPLAGLWVLGSYWVAQALIASLLAPSAPNSART